MSRFLSPEWFEEVAEQTARAGGAGGAGSGSGTGGAGDADLVLEQVVTGTPGGEVRYLVVVDGGKPRIEFPLPKDARHRQADVTITTTWETAVAVAQGTLASQTALMEGRLRIRGNLARLAEQASGLAGSDPVPASVRESTTY